MGIVVRKIVFALGKLNTSSVEEKIFFLQLLLLYGLLWCLYGLAVVLGNLLCLDFLRRSLN